MFRRWPSSSTAAALQQDDGQAWQEHADEVSFLLSSRPRDAVLFVLLTLEDAQTARRTAHELGLTDGDVWDELIKAYAKLDPLAVLSVHRHLVQGGLVEAGAEHYRRAARRLATMRKLAAGTNAEAYVDEFIRDLRAAHKRRPRLKAMARPCAARCPTGLLPDKVKAARFAKSRRPTS